MEIKRGMRGKLFERFTPGTPLEVTMNTAGSAVYDYCCFGVDENDILSDDRYMVFYNQPSSPQNEISYRADDGSAVYTVSPDRLPDTIRKLVFTASIDGEGNMGEITRFEVSIGQNGCEPLVLSLTGADFSAERAIISVELYLKNEWRYSAVAQGFNGGLSDLLEAYGGEEAPDEEEEYQPEEAPQDIPEGSAEAEITPPETETEPAAPAEENIKPSYDLEKPEAPEEENITPALDLAKPQAEPSKAEPAAPELPKIELRKLGDKPISLVKNDKVELRKKNDKPVNSFMVGLGWDPVKAGASIDCDSSVFLCKNGKLVDTDEDIVALYHQRHKSGAVIHHGDNLTGEGAGDDEKISIELNKVPKDYDRIVIVANIFLSRITRQHFGKVKNCYIRICENNGKELYSTLSDRERKTTASASLPSASRNKHQIIRHRQSFSR